MSQIIDETLQDLEKSLDQVIDTLGPAVGKTPKDISRIKRLWRRHVKKIYGIIIAGLVPFIFAAFKTAYDSLAVNIQFSLFSGAIGVIALLFLTALVLIGLSYRNDNSQAEIMKSALEKVAEYLKSQNNKNEMARIDQEKDHILQMKSMQEFATIAQTSTIEQVNKVLDKLTEKGNGIKLEEDNRYQTDTDEIQTREGLVLIKPLKDNRVKKEDDSQ